MPRLMPITPPEQPDRGKQNKGNHRHPIARLMDDVGGDLTECLQALDQRFQGATYSLKSLFRDEQRRILSRILDSTLGEAEAACRHVYEHHAPLLSFLADLHTPLPGLLRATAEAVLSSAVERALAEAEPDLERVRSLLDTAARQHINLDTAGLEFALRQRLTAVVEQWARKPADLHLLELAESVASVARVVPFEVNLWNSQNVYYELVQAVSSQARLRPGNGADDLLERLAGMGERLGLAASAPCSGGSEHHVEACSAGSRTTGLSGSSSRQAVVRDV